MAYGTLKHRAFVTYNVGYRAYHCARSRAGYYILIVQMVVPSSNNIVTTTSDSLDRETVGEMSLRKKLMLPSRLALCMYTRPVYVCMYT